MARLLLSTLLRHLPFFDMGLIGFSFIFTAMTVFPSTLICSSSGISENYDLIEKLIDK